MNRIGVTVVAGFLGSGKTTLLRRVVRDERLGPKVAVIVNELGALGLDEELIRAAATTSTMHMRQLTSGCICCTLRGDLGQALLELAAGRDRPPPEHIVIETSGAARASEVSYAINAIGFEAPFRTDAVLTLVDAGGAARCYREHEELFADQVRTADVVLINKGDLVPGEPERAVLLDWLRPLAPRATFLWTVQADVPLGLLFAAEPLPRVAEAVPEPGHDHEHDPIGEPGAAHGLRSLTVPVPWPVQRQGLEDLLEELAETIYRIKGVVDGEGGPLLVQAVGDRIELDEIDEASSLVGSDRRLIFIGTLLDEGAIRSALSRIRLS